MSTPRLWVDRTILQSNLREMQNLATSRRIKMRPHIKAHKCREIMHMQLAEGASGITVAKLGEAETMVTAGAKNVFVAYPLVGEEKLDRLVALSERALVTVAVDNFEVAQRMAARFDEERPIEVLIEVDSGLNRCGVLPEEAVFLARALITLPNLKLKGVFTHAGQAYGATPEKVRAIGLMEAHTVVAVRDALHQYNINIETVSTGSTPTAKHNLEVAGVTEIRPGNYVWNDAIQVGLGVATLSQCALTVEATVVSSPAPGRIVIDAGSKALGLDKGAHGLSIVSGFGHIIGWPTLVIERLSEEHGVVTFQGTGPAIGQKLRIVPNHACVVVNLADKLWVTDTEQWLVAARGRSD